MNISKGISLSLIAAMALSQASCARVGGLAADLTGSKTFLAKYDTTEAIIRPDEQTGHIMYPEDGEEYNADTDTTVVLETVKGNGDMFYVRGAMIERNSKGGFNPGTVYAAVDVKNRLIVLARAKAQYESGIEMQSEYSQSRELELKANIQGTQGAGELSSGLAKPMTTSMPEGFAKPNPVPLFLSSTPGMQKMGDASRTAENERNNQRQAPSKLQPRLMHFRMRGFEGLKDLTFRKANTRDPLADLGDKKLWVRHVGAISALAQKIREDRIRKGLAVADLNEKMPEDGSVISEDTISSQLLPYSYGVQTHYRISLMRIEKDELLAALSKIAATNTNCSLEQNLTLEGVGNRDAGYLKKIGCDWLVTDRQVLQDAFRNGVGLVDLSTEYGPRMIVASLRTPDLLGKLDPLIARFIDGGSLGDISKYGHIHEAVARVLSGAQTSSTMQKILDSQKQITLSSEVKVAVSAKLLAKSFNGKLSDVINEFDKYTVNNWLGQPKCFHGIGGKAGFADQWSWDLGIVLTEKGSKKVPQCEIDWIQPGGKTYTPSAYWTENIKNSRVAYLTSPFAKVGNKCAKVKSTLKIDNVVVPEGSVTKTVCLD